MKGYKIFNSDWTSNEHWKCLDFQYEIGGVYETNINPEKTTTDFKFFTELQDCFNFKTFDITDRVVEINVLGDVERVKDLRPAISRTNKFEIVKELSWYEVLEQINKGVCNTGKNNEGDQNSGDYNWGMNNSGSYNEGDYNSGDNNEGHLNTGHFNQGTNNSGNYNYGDYNTGTYNEGMYNSGNKNIGYDNTGHYNWGSRNTGSFNLGNANVGERNCGDENIGRANNGNGNLGNHNNGNHNYGDFNKSNYSNGCFNTKANKIHLFNKPSDLTYEEWLNSSAYRILESMPYDTITEISGTDDGHRHYFYKIETTDVERQMWYNGLSDEDKKTIKSIPNFNAQLFKEITGIDV